MLPEAIVYINKRELPAACKIWYLHWRPKWEWSVNVLTYIFMKPAAYFVYIIYDITKESEYNFTWNICTQFKHLPKKLISSFLFDIFDKIIFYY